MSSGERADSFGSDERARPGGSDEGAESVTSDPWTEIGVVTPTELADPALELHWAVQFIASAGQTFAEPRDDDSHRAMTWSAGLDAFVGVPFAVPYPFRLALRPRDLTLTLLDRTDEELGSFPLRGRRRDEGYEWLALGMATYLGGAPPVIGRPEYDVPEHPVRHDARFTVDGAALATLSSLYAGAADLLEGVAAAETGAAPVRCWPHHFDIATLITVASDDAGRPARTIGVGLAPGGGGYDTWYWYVTPRPRPDSSGLGELSGAGAWHTDGWTGAVLTGESITRTPEGRRRDLVRSFVEEAIAASKVALAGAGPRRSATGKAP